MNNDDRLESVCSLMVVLYNVWRMCVLSPSVTAVYIGMLQTDIDLDSLQHVLTLKGFFLRVQWISPLSCSGSPLKGLVFATDRL